ncbi:MAG: hypothetical protein RLZZ387_5352 [Chloroflexota bacterium]|jgi:dipeptidyl aminopeptidase/acylaminoacyl peptidase
MSETVPVHDHALPSPFTALPAGASGPQFSPDGQTIAYMQDGQILLAPVDTPSEPVPLCDGWAPRWRPGRNELLILRSHRAASLWLQPPTPGETGRPLANAPRRIAAYAWSPDGRQIAVIERGALHKPGALRLLEPDTGTSERRARLPAYEVEGPLRWSPDGHRLAWSVEVSPDDRTNMLHEVRLLNLQHGTIRRVVPPGSCQTSAPVWRPDGRALALLATPHPYGFQALYGLASWHVEGSATRYLTRDPLVIAGAAWSPDGKQLYLSARDRGITQQLYALDVTTGALRRLTDGVRSFGPPAISPDGRWLASTVISPDQLAEIWLVATDGTCARSISAASRQLDAVPNLCLGTPDLVRWRGRDGLELEGLLLYPPPYGPDRPPPGPLPTIVDLHGGPIQPVSLGLGEHPVSLDGLHDLAMRGYLCFAADYRRSGSYGWAPLQAALDAGDLIGDDADDILAGVEHLVMRGLTDPARLGLRGFSHGGLLANWLAATGDRFQAVVSIEGPSDLGHMELDTILEIWLGGRPDEVPERYHRCSPLRNIRPDRPPTLLLYGEHSVFTRRGEGARFAEALRAAGAEVELLTLPGEGHMFFRLEHRQQLLNRAAAWFDRHLRG